MPAPELPISFFEPRTSDAVSSPPERLSAIYTPVYLDREAIKQLDADHISHEDTPRWVPAGEMIRKESRRECTYKDAVLVAIYSDGCAGYNVTEECAQITDVYWVRSGQPDKLVDPRIKTDVRTSLQRVVVCPGGSISVGPRETGATMVAGEHPQSDRLIPVELPHQGRTLVGPQGTAGVVPGEEEFWMYRPPLVYADGCNAIATYVLMKRTVTVTGPPATVAKGKPEPVQPEVTKSVQYYLCDEQVRMALLKSVAGPRTFATVSGELRPLPLSSAARRASATPAGKPPNALAK